MRKTLLAAIVASIVLIFTGCQKEIPHYRGYYFNAMIEDAHVIELKDQKSIPALRGYVREVHWQLDRPIDGHMRVKFSENKNSKSFIGQLVNREALDIIALDHINVATDSRFRSDSSVQINGAAAVSKVDVLKKNFLPRGDYIFRLKVHGTNNWDRKEIYVQVR